MFRSAMPFGASLFYVLLFGSILIGGTLLLVGWTRDWRLLRRSRACLVIVGIGWLCLNAYLHSLMDWNPCIDSEELVIGTWADERETITLHADHRVDYHSWNEGFSGTWSLNDWNLRLQGEGIDTPMRFIRYDGELRLLTAPPEDPDVWNGSTGLRQKQESKGG